MKSGSPVVCGMLILAMATPAFARTVEIKTTEAEQIVELGSPIVLINESLAVPAEALFKGMGFEVQSSDGGLQVERGEISLKVVRGSAYLNGRCGEEPIFASLDIAPFEVNDVLCVPLEIVEVLGYTSRVEGNRGFVGGNLIQPAEEGEI